MDYKLTIREKGLKTNKVLNFVLYLHLESKIGLTVSFTNIMQIICQGLQEPQKLQASNNVGFTDVISVLYLLVSYL